MAWRWMVWRVGTAHWVALATKRKMRRTFAIEAGLEFEARPLSPDVDLNVLPKWYPVSFECLPAFIRDSIVVEAERLAYEADVNAVVSSIC